MFTFIFNLITCLVRIIHSEQFAHGSSHSASYLFNGFGHPYMSPSCQVHLNYQSHDHIIDENQKIYVKDVKLKIDGELI